MKKKIFALVLALLMVISLAGCKEISLQTNMETTAPTQETSSDEQSATETWDSISDDETEATTQIEATQATQSQETTEKKKESGTTVPAETKPADTTPKPTTPAKDEEKPPATEKPTTETNPPEDTKASEETTPPPKEEETQPTDPPETEPPATEQTEVIDTDALVSYGRSYAVSTYGYESSPGLRDGYYPAYSCRIRTMEEGYSAIRACVDDTTRALLAIPGTQIVVEIDGIAYRARIDIVITAHGNGEYSVTVYYG